MEQQSVAAAGAASASGSGTCGTRGRLRLLAGAAVLAAAWLSPLPRLAGSAFAAQVLVSVSVLAVAAPLIAAALVADARLMARLPRSLVSPIPVAVFGFAVVWLWHVPVPYGLARLSPGCQLAEQASFLATGLLLWTTALRPAGAAEGDASAGVLALLMGATQMVLLGTLLALAPQPLYTHAIASLGDAYAELAAQRTGGMIMLLGGLPYLAGSVYLVHRLLFPSTRNASCEQPS